jgi:hypothetical protein
VGIGTTSPTTAKLDVAGTALVENAKLKAIAESNTDTAVDVFVYDTRKDSDGGAWRKRTQHTSWYNEALNTSTRGARKEFPSVAVIVAEAYQLTIYDGDDPDMPMWMVFNGQAAGGYLGYGIGAGRSLSSVVALNGAIHTGGLVGNWATDINFITERGYFWGEVNSGYTHTAIVNRNTASSINEVSSTIELGHGIINDIAVTALPNAPIDADTGLPVPTIAVATNGGVSVIKDDGSVVDITAGAGSNYSAVSWVDITKNNYLIFEQDSSSNPRSVFHVPIPSKDRTTQTSDGNITDKVIMKYYANGSHLPYPCFNGGGVIEGIGLSKDNQALRSAYGDLTILEPNVADPEQGKVAYIASDYNTGWMHGDIKLATLSDTAAANNFEYVEGYGDFTAGSEWTVNSGWSTSGNVATKTGGTGNNYISKSIGTAFTPGKWYQAEFDLLSGNGASVLLVNRHINGVIKPYTGGATNVDVEFFANGSKYYAIWKQSSLNTGIISLYSGQSVSLDNFKVYEINALDRSVNSNPLIRHGTVTKTAVATGAELVGYGFSANNYLLQPYNSDLNFGTGDFSISAWVQLPTAGSPTRGIICEREGTDYGWQFFQYNSRFYFYVGSTSAPAYTSQAYSNYDVWYNVVVGVKSGKIFIYVNGEYNVEVAGTPTTVTATDAVLSVGVQTNATSEPFTGGQIALLRISATAPSEEQIAKMYNDEKHLFQPNAKAVIGGTSDAVTALAYDDDTELLHVGSSWGRSVFQGLNRVEFSSDVVTTAISASNGFIVEE